MTVAVALPAVLPIKAEPDHSVCRAQPQHQRNFWTSMASSSPHTPQLQRTKSSLTLPPAPKKGVDPSAPYQTDQESIDSSSSQSGEEPVVATQPLDSQPQQYAGASDSESDVAIRHTASTSTTGSASTVPSASAQPSDSSSPPSKTKTTTGSESGATTNKSIATAPRLVYFTFPHLLVRLWCDSHQQYEQYCVTCMENITAYH